MKLLNIACGDRYHQDWINIDFHPDSKNVQRVNILDGLPFKDNSMDAIYCSHFLGHITEQQAIFVLSESKRLLKHNGICRIVCPSLENICREYLKILEEVDHQPFSQEKYRWIVIELLDQIVRVNNGGKMLDLFKNIAETKNVKLADYVLERTGEELIKETITKKKKVITFDKIKNKFLYIYIRCVGMMIPKNIRDFIFIQTSIGERQQWVYDNYSLGRAFKDLGFKDIIIKSFNESDILNFNNYELDIKKDGTPYKGDSSLYIEARK